VSEASLIENDGQTQDDSCAPEVLTENATTTIRDEDAPLRIAVLGTGLRVGGGYTVGINMLRAFARVGPQHRYLLAMTAGLEYEAAAKCLPHCELLTFRHGGLLRRWWFDRRRVPRAVRGFGPDVILGLGGYGLLDPPVPQAVFPQQAQLFYPARHAGCVPLRGRLMHRLKKHYFGKQLPKTQLVLAQTAVVARRVRETYGYRGHTLVCSTAVSPLLLEHRKDQPIPESLEPLRGRLKLLYLSRYYGHKNFEGILDLFERHRDALSDVAVITTVSPEGGPYARRYLHEIRRRGLEDRIVNVGPVPHEQVGQYYAHCDALFMPTLLESFGIPYVEAMAHDLPILTSDFDFAHAVCGDAALFFDPWNTDSMRDAILRLKNDPAQRERLITAGRERLRRQFPSWDQVALTILRELRRLVNEWTVRGAVSGTGLCK
jgi:glycosyltransferase involved in cell wall biosynthesis